MGEVTELLERLEAATADDKGLMIDAWEALDPLPLPNDGDGLRKRYNRKRRFILMLDAEAYESAALTLVPEGWTFSVGSNRKSGDAWARLDPDSDDLLDPRGVLVRRAPTPALAIVIAALRATEARQQ